MKTVLKMVLTALIAFSFASSALASVSADSLVLTLVDASGQNTLSAKEYAINLGDVEDIVWDGGLLTTIDFSTVVSEDLDTVYYSQIAMSAFATTYTGGRVKVYTGYFGTNSESVDYNSNYFGDFIGNTSMYYNAGTTDVVVDLPTTDSAKTIMSNGTYAGIVGSDEGTVTYATIDSVGYADLYLQTVTSEGLAEIIGVLRIESDGSVYALAYEATAEVPVPAAVWMLASGLIGLVGVRRKS